MSPFIAQGLPHQSGFEVMQGQSNLGLAVAQKYKVEDGGNSRLVFRLHASAHVGTEGLIPLLMGSFSIPT